ncbi:MAG: NAD(P)-dependent oxidoreductase [Planctomycetota bacterium]|nr:NAD(P)-dependent oxidoreductase [Planctomycetota bacterium]
MKVLVTGATGFLGRHVVEALLQRGHGVRAMVRPATKVDRFGWDDRVEIFRADLRTSRNLAEAFDGCDAVIHLAACVVGDEDSQVRSTVVGTERLLQGMAKSNCRRIVLASSYSVYDWSRIRGTLDESSPIESEIYTRDGYAIAKIWQERLTRQLAKEHDWELVLLRPGFIWGRGNEYLAGIGQSVGRMHMVFGGLRRLPLSHVENCADVFALAVDHPQAIGETFNVVDDKGPLVWDYTGAWLKRSGAKGFRMPVSYAAAMNTARLARLVSRILFRGGGKLPSILVPCRFEARFKPLRFTNAKLRDRLGWKPPLSWKECLEHTYGPAPRTSTHAAPPSSKPSPQPADKEAVGV